MPLSASPTPVADLAGRLLESTPPRETLSLALGECRVQFDTNSKDLLEELKSYFSPFLALDSRKPSIHVIALEVPEPDLGLDFLDWPRDAGKQGRKDSYVDLVDGRVCRKVRTGMQYCLSDGFRMVFGPCGANANQVVNFIISQQIGWLLDRGWSLCHASAVAHDGGGIAISGFSGGGKSTLALHLMRRGLDFVSNDRLLIASANATPRITGVPKQPRINPGTVLNNPALRSVIPASRLLELRDCQARDLWDLEEKYDADVEQLFGKDRFKLAATLHAYVVLNWRRDGDRPTRLEPVRLEERPDLLAAIMKAPGPFHIGPDGASVANAAPDPAEYLDVLGTEQVYELGGKVDFNAAEKLLFNLFPKV
jgi:HprK-related kinase B